MSKSDAVGANVIALLDSVDDISRKIRRSVTDSGSEIVVREDKPGVTNLLHILAASTNTATATLEDQYQGQGYGRFKSDVADAVIALVEPIQARYREIRSNAGELDGLLTTGAVRARSPARTTLAAVHKALGLIPK